MRKRALRAVAISTVALSAVALTSAAAPAAVNLVVNSGMEALDAQGMPDCWQVHGWGDNTVSATSIPEAHSGERAFRLTLSGRTSGDRKLMMRETPECAPAVTAGRRYELAVSYRTTTPSTVITMFRHDADGWHYWTDLASLPVTATYQRATAVTPEIPPGTDRVIWGVTIYADGQLDTDDYSMTEQAPPVTPTPCQGTTPCPAGQWDVLPYESPVPAIHSVQLRNGRVLLIAGSGNDPDQFAAGTFTSTVYDPVAETFTAVPTPQDFFCAGHTQLPDGRVLVMGGNLDYPAADGSHGYKGLRVSYIFDPETNSYVRTNDMTGGHWYPSATTLGNGDVLSLGGLGETSEGTVATEYFSNAQGRWLAGHEIQQTWRFWGLYPAMILMADGRLFYTGSHVFGDGLPGTGASIYDYPSGQVTEVPGLREKDARDQSMSVLLPPAQDQRVLTLGGGNINTNPDAHRLTDIIDLKAQNPTYTPGPDIPTGHNHDGSRQLGHQGKMYVSAVLLPDGKVFETGGALHNRADPVFEASMFDPVTNTFTPGMAVDPVGRGYHSSAFLLPDGRVMAVGNNPGDGSFDQRMSVYSPWYMFAGDRPRITATQRQDWAYGSVQRISVEGRVAKAALIRPAAVTHSSDPNQRYVALPLSADGNEVDVQLTGNPNLAPPGWYMLFVISDTGVPSVAKWVRVG